MITAKNLIKEYENDGNVKLIFYKEKPTNEVFDVRIEIDGKADTELGLFYFTFDKNKIFNYWEDYPEKLTKEEKRKFDKDNPHYAK